MGTLYIVATPIGNLEDITLRAVRVLREADRVLAEDTRVTKKLFAHYGITTSLFSYRQHANRGVTEKILKMLEEGKNLALVTDAGTPGVADPGNRLVEQAIGRFGDQIHIIPIPGPSALTALASVAGISMDRFCFLGYPPAKKGRKKFFEGVAQSKHPVILYESPHRVLKTLKELSETAGRDRHVILGRELTKKFETIYRGSLSEIAEQIVKKGARGEFVIIVEADKRGYLPAGRQVNAD